MQLLGIGRNGHIGFNEPTSRLSPVTRVKTLTDSTREANRAYFAAAESTPKYALTMGTGSILATKSCVLLATGGSKALAVAQVIKGAVSAACPASALQLHRKVTVVLDGATASELQLKGYYRHVPPGGSKSEFE